MTVRKTRTLPKVGSTYEKKYRGTKYTMTVVALGSNKRGYRVAGKVYSSPSAAAKAITSTEVNGWVFWVIE